VEATSHRIELAPGNAGLDLAGQVIFETLVQGFDVPAAHAVRVIEPGKAGAGRLDDVLFFVDSKTGHGRPFVMVSNWQDR